jgi:methionyl-tRNA synthetase
MSEKRVLITAALPYANGALHFGHMVGNFLPADCFSRFSRLIGHRTLFICGSDEYGVAITLSAQKHNTTPKAHADHFHRINKGLLDKMGVAFDCFSRTTNPFHKELVQEFFTTLLNKGSIEKRRMEQLYSEKEKQFLADRYVVGQCPKCGYEKARGDECPSCARSFEATDLINPRSLLTDSPLIRKKSDHWFFACEKFRGELEQFLEKKDWKSNVLEFSKSYLKELRSRCITRDGKWGVEVPLDEAEGRVLYVWFDAPLGYISASMQYSQESGVDYKEFWCNPETKYVQFMGKDNIFFHSIFFPSMIMAHGSDYKQVDDLVANEFLLLEGKQFSKSSGWTIDLDEFLNTFDPDATRFALMSNAPENHDSDFRWDDFLSRVNQDLVGKFANFIHRSLTFIHNFMGKCIPKRYSYNEIDLAFEQNLLKVCDEVKSCFESYQIRKACSAIMHMCSLANSYFDAKAPWKLVKNEDCAEDLSNTLYLCVKAARLLALVSNPIMPNISQKILALLAEPNTSLSWKVGIAHEPDSGLKLEKPTPLFQKVDVDVINKKKEGLMETVQCQENCFENLKDSIAFEDFEKLDLRVATVISVEKVKKSNKLLKFELDLGFEKRVVLSGIARHYSDLEALVGIKVVFLANLKPIKIMGIESQGMILSAASKSNNDLELLQIKKIASGNTIK